jgi:hypothetical protein
MDAWATGLITLLLVLAGVLFGLRLQGILPEHHLSAESRDVVNLVTGLLATLSALVLGLLIASSKSTFDALTDDLKRGAAKVIVVDRLLAQYGPEAKAARGHLKRYYSERVAQLFPGEGSDGKPGSALAEASSIDDFHQSVRLLAPNTDAQRAILARIERTVDEVSEARWLAFEQAGNSTPPVFLAVLVSWLVMMFASFALFSPRHTTALVALFCGALAVATSLFLIEEMNQPLTGLIAIPSEPMRNALSVLGR